MQKTNPIHPIYVLAVLANCSFKCPRPQSRTLTKDARSNLAKDGSV